MATKMFFEMYDIPLSAQQIPESGSSTLNFGHESQRTGVARREITDVLKARATRHISWTKRCTPAVTSYSYLNNGS